MSDHEPQMPIEGGLTEDELDNLSFNRRMERAYAYDENELADADKAVDGLLATLTPEQEQFRAVIEDVVKKTLEEARQIARRSLTEAQSGKRSYVSKVTPDPDSDLDRYVTQAKGMAEADGKTVNIDSEQPSGGE